MTRNYICNGEKYEVGGPKGDTIGLPVFFKGLPQSIVVKNETLLLKDAFHVSLVCIGKIIEKHGVQIPDFVRNVIADFCTFTQHTPIELICYRDEFRFVKENERKSVVVMCDIANLDKFFAFLNQKYALSLEYPPTHMTLYTLQPNRGIFLTDSADIMSLTEVVPNPTGMAF